MRRYAEYRCCKLCNHTESEEGDSHHRLSESFSADEGKKNEIELENNRKAHIKDAVAMTKFMYWLKNNIGKETITKSVPVIIWKVCVRNRNTIWG